MTKGAISDGVVYHAGFPNAGEDQHLAGLSLDKLIIQHRASTFFWRLEEDIAEMGWHTDALLVVDRALPLRKNGIAVVIVDEAFMICRVKNGTFMTIANKPLKGEVRFWGMVTYAIQEVR